MRSSLLFRLAVSFALGVIVQFHLGIDFPFYLFAPLLLILISFSLPFFVWRKWSNGIYGITSIVTFFCFGLFLANWHDVSKRGDYFANHTKKESISVVRIIEPPQQKSKTVKCIAEVEKVDGRATRGKCLIYLSKTNRALQLKYGDVVLLKKEFVPPVANGNPHEFDYPEYLRVKGIHHQCFAKDADWLKVAERPGFLMRYVYSWREELATRLKGAHLAEKNHQVAKALLLGQRDELDDDLLASYASAGATHVLAVSGLHVGIVMLILSFLLKPIKRLQYLKQVYPVLVICGVWLFAFVSGLSPSVSRAALMFSFVVIGGELQRETSVYQSIVLSAFVLMLINPYVIFEVSFQLSYSAVLGIVFLQPKIYRLLYTRFWVLDKVWQIMSVSLAAQLATFPLVLHYFHQFPNYFLLSNLLVVPMAFVILFTGILFFAVSAIPGLGDATGIVLNFFLSTLNTGVSWIDHLPAAISGGFWLEWYEVVLLYVLLMSGLLAILSRRIKPVFLALGLTIVLIGLNMGRHIAIRSENQIVFYHVNGADAIDIFYGDKNIFITTSDVLTDKQKLDFCIQQNWLYRMGEDKPAKTESLDDAGIMRLGYKSLAIFDQHDLSDERELKIPQTDMVYLHHLRYLPQDLLFDWNKHLNKLILGSGISTQLRKFIYDHVNNGIIHDLTIAGALEIEF